MGNRAVALNTDGSATLRAGRFYRLLLVVNGQPGKDELYEALAERGFAAHHDLAVSWPGDWETDKPTNWPDEAPPVHSANEFLVRVSGSFDGPTRTVVHDAPIKGGGAFTIAQVWDCGGSAAPALATTEDAKDAEPEKKKGNGTALAVAGILGAVLAYKLIGGRHEASRETERMGVVEDRARRVRRVQRVNDLLANGHSRGDAEAVAETEEWEREGHHHQEEA